MRIKSIEIKNFKCLGPEPVSLNFSDDIIVLIGENNVGKSSVLQAINYFFSGKNIPIEFFYNKVADELHPLEITIEFDNLSDEDLEHKVVHPYAFKQEGNYAWKLKKKYFQKEDGSMDRKYFAFDGNDWKENPSGWRQTCDDLFTEEKMQTVFIEAVKEVADTTKPSTRSASVFQQLFNIILQPKLQNKAEYKALIKALKNYDKLFESNSKLDEISNLENEISSRWSRIINAKGIIISSPPSEDALLPTPQLVTNDSRDIDVLPEHQGHGMQRSIIFSLLELLGESKSPTTKLVGPRNLILIEEPEIYMHPQMERKIADTLYNIATNGKAQVICSTHSPIFIRIAEKHKALIRMIRCSDNTLCVIQKGELFSGADREDKRRRLQMIINFDPSVNEAFFAKKVVLVEGDTEIAVFKEAAELLDYFDTEEKYHKKRDTTFINCRGKWTIAAFQEVLNHFGIDYVVIHDKDETSEEAGANGRILDYLGGDETRRKLFDKKIETILKLTYTGKQKPIKALERVHELDNLGQLESAIGEYVKFAYGV
jgi:predicted ATP-dependent endonuclease of OLD family